MILNDRKYEKLDEIPSGRASKTITKGCLVLEGGAFRGLYSQGVMDALMKNNINFECTIGVSAGAMGGMNYVSGQIGRSARINLEFRHDQDYIGAIALLHSRSPLNLDFAIRKNEKLEPFDETAFYNPTRRFVAVVTDCTTGNPIYCEKGHCRDIFEAVKASASMPFVSPMVDVDGVPCLDGGCSCKIPYRWAIDSRYENIVVVKTRERGFRKDPAVKNTARLFYRDNPEFALKLDESNADYDQQCDEIDELEKQGRLFVIAPSEPVTVGRVEGDMNKLGDLYWLGYNDATRNLFSLNKYLK
ncbi:MAG: patatin family protein [Butyrivibrio sp.]|nr:patatin family protein [Clostridia bacterium]MBQ6406553.1 patatin family protein [Butyrivibrio sp.]